MSDGPDGHGSAGSFGGQEAAYSAHPLPPVTASVPPLSGSVGLSTTEPTPPETERRQHRVEAGRTRRAGIAAIVTLAVAGLAGGGIFMFQQRTTVSPPAASDAERMAASGATSGSPRSVFAGTGRRSIKIPAPGSAPRVALWTTNASDANLTVTISSDKVGTGNGIYLFAVGRWVTDAGDYRLQTRLRADGYVGVSILRTNSSGAQTVISREVPVPSYRFVAGSKLHVRFQVTGTSPTMLRARVWPTTMSEPPTWLRSATDSTAVLQDTGSVGVVAFLSGTATNAPVVTSFDDLRVRPTTP